MDKNRNYSLNKRLSRSKFEGMAALCGAGYRAMGPGKKTEENYYEDHEFELI